MTINVLCTNISTGEKKKETKTGRIQYCFIACVANGFQLFFSLRHT